MFLFKKKYTSILWYIYAYQLNMSQQMLCILMYYANQYSVELCILCLKCPKPPDQFVLAMHFNDINKTKSIVEYGWWDPIV